MSCLLLLHDGIRSDPAPLGVIGCSAPKGVEDDKEIAWRKGFLRQIGYKG